MEPIVQKILVVGGNGFVGQFDIVQVNPVPPH